MSFGSGEFGGGGGDAPYVANLSPADGSAITATTPITFSLVDENGIGLAPLWMKYDEVNAERRLIYIGTGVSASTGFSVTTITDVNGDRTRLDFSVLPDGGWTDDIGELTIMGADGNISVI